MLVKIKPQDDSEEEKLLVGLPSDFRFEKYHEDGSLIFEITDDIWIDSGMSKLSSIITSTDSVDLIHKIQPSSLLFLDYKYGSDIDSAAPEEKFPEDLSKFLGRDFKVHNTLCINAIKKGDIVKFGMSPHGLNIFSINGEKYEGRGWSIGNSNKAFELLPK